MAEGKNALPKEGRGGKKGFLKKRKRKTQQQQRKREIQTVFNGRGWLKKSRVNCWEKGGQERGTHTVEPEKNTPGPE